MQVFELAPAGAEVVDTEADAEASELAELLGGEVGVAHQRRLGDLHADLVGGDARSGDRLIDESAEVVVAELPGGQVDPDPHGFMIVGAADTPAACLEARFGDYPASEVDAQPGFLGERDELTWRDQPAVRRLPADQCFEADNVARLEVEFRLVVEAKLAVGDRPPERSLGVVALEVDALLNFVVGDVAAAFSLGVVDPGTICSWGVGEIALESGVPNRLHYSPAP